MAAVCLHNHTFTRTAIHSPGQAGKETILKEKQEVESISYCLHPPSVIPLHTLSVMFYIVLGAEVRTLDIIMLLFKRATTIPRVCFRNTMKYIFLFFLPVFLLNAARQFVAAVLSRGSCLLGFFFPRRDLGPDAKSTSTTSLYPPSIPPSSPDKPPLSPQGESYHALH